MTTAEPDLIAEVLHRRALQFVIDGEHEAGAAHRFAAFALVLALLDAARVDDDFALAGFAVERGLHRRFEARLADAHVRIAQIHGAAWPPSGSSSMARSRSRCVGFCT